MRYPKHLILDLRTTDNTLPYLGCSEGVTRLPVLLRLNTTYRTNLPTLVRSTDNLNTSLKKSISGQPGQSQTLTTSLFNIHFIRKEKLYTKLKYSRCPQYDMVSGGFAALLAGFVGFLISEKFGIELVDSGDFYNAFMYGVFACFSLRPLLRVYSKDDTPYNPLSLKYLLLFILDLVKLSLNGFWALLRRFSNLFL